MTQARRQRRRTKRRFEAANTITVGRVQVARTAVATHTTWRWVRLVLASVLIVAVGLALWIGLDDHFYVYDADVVGAVHVVPEEVFEASGLKGLHILWARPAQIESRILAAIPGLMSASVTCTLPAHCTIVVVERQPKTMWDENGQLWWVDAEGVVFPADGVLAEGWLVQGPLPRDEEGRLDGRVRVALAELWASGPGVSPALQYVPGRGLLLIDTRGWRVFVGQGTGMRERLQVLEWLAADLQARGITPRFVDVRFPDAPYYSVVNDW